jgi:putative ABC transport system permease protein
LLFSFIETLLIGQLGGIVGIILGILIGYGIATLSFAFVIPWVAILAAFLTSFMVAIVSGLYQQSEPLIWIQSKPYDMSKV